MIFNFTFHFAGIIFNMNDSEELELKYFSIFVSN